MCILRPSCIETARARAVLPVIAVAGIAEKECCRMEQDTTKPQRLSKELKELQRTGVLNQDRREHEATHAPWKPFSPASETRRQAPDAAARTDAALSSAATNEGAGASSGGRNSRTDADGECLTVNRRSGAAQMCDEPGEASSTLTHPGQ